VQALPRHYRQVLSLRLVHGLELQQIAHSLDVPLGTVKVRLHRGLALLRRALPTGLTASVAVLATPSLGLAAARQAVLAEVTHLAAATTATTATTAVAATGIVLGGWVMKKLVLGAAAIALAAAGWFTFAWREPAPVVNASPPAPAPVVAAAAAPDATPEAGVMPAASPADAPRASERSAVPTTGSLVVHAVWADDAPAAFVTVSAYRKRVANSPRAKCDADGRARFEALEPGDYIALVSQAKQDSKASHVDVRAGEEATLKIVLGGDLRLRVLVVDSEGAPRRDANVWVNGPVEGYRTIGSTDAAGELSWRGLPVSSVFARCAGSEPSAVHELPQSAPADVPRDPVAIRLVLGPRSCTVTGTVVDPQGRPAAGARVAIACDDTIKTARPELLFTADAQGRFSCDEVPAGERSIVASFSGLAPAIARVKPKVDEPATITLQLRSGVTLSGRCTDASGAPVANVQVDVQRPYLLGLSTAATETRTDSDGRYELRGIVPGSFRVYVDVEPRLEGSFTAADGQHVTWNPTKEPERAITGVIVDADDKPLANWRVSVMAPPRPLGGSSPREFRTDAQGRFRVTGLEDVPYRVFVFAASSHPDHYRSAAASVACVIENDVRPSEQLRTIRVPATAMPSAWIEGSLALPDGVSAKAELSLYARSMQGGGFWVPQERLEAGTTTFRIGPLPPGQYSLLCDIEGRGRLSHHDLRLIANETLRLPPLPFDAQRPCVIMLRHADGRPATGAAVKLKSSLMPCRETAPGRYESMPVDEGADEAVVRGPDFAPAAFAITRSASAVNELTVRGATPVVVRLLPSTPRARWIGALRVIVTDAHGAQLVNDMVQLDGGADFPWPIGLLPGTYKLGFDMYGEAKGSTTVVVGTEPLQIDLQLAK